MKILHKENINGDELYGVTEFTACRIYKSSKWSEYCVRLSTESPFKFYKIIRSERMENGCYKWLQLDEANRIVQSLYKHDCLDLTRMGNYHIFEEEYTQSVYIRNDIDEYSEEYIPIIVSLSAEENV